MKRSLFVKNWSDEELVLFFCKRKCCVVVEVCWIGNLNGSDGWIVLFWSLW